MRQTMAEIGRVFANITKNNFGTSGIDRPKQWRALSVKYQERIMYFGPPKLVLTGQLRNSIQIGYVQSNSVTVESSIDYASVHQFGGGNNIPARPYFPVNSATSYGPHELTPYAAGEVRKILDMKFR